MVHFSRIDYGTWEKFLKEIMNRKFGRHVCPPEHQPCHFFGIRWQKKTKAEKEKPLKTLKFQGFFLKLAERASWKSLNAKLL